MNENEFEKWSRDEARFIIQHELYNYETMQEAMTRCDAFLNMVVAFANEDENNDIMAEVGNAINYIFDRIDWNESKYCCEEE